MKNKRNVKIQETFTASTSDLISAKTELEVSQINIGRNIKEQENKYKLA